MLNSHSHFPKTRLLFTKHRLQVNSEGISVTILGIASFFLPVVFLLWYLVSTSGWTLRLTVNGLFTTPVVFVFSPNTAQSLCFFVCLFVYISRLLHKHSGAKGKHFVRPQLSRLTSPSSANGYVELLQPRDKIANTCNS